MTLDGFGGVYCSSGDARWSSALFISAPIFLERLGCAAGARGISVSAGERSLSSRCRTLESAVRSSCLAMVDFGRMPATTQAIRWQQLTAFVSS